MTITMGFTPLIRTLSTITNGFNSNNSLECHHGREGGQHQQIRLLLQEQLPQLLSVSHQRNRTDEQLIII
jgi:hypothetical protein